MLQLASITWHIFTMRICCGRRRPDVQELMAPISSQQPQLCKHLSMYLHLTFKWSQV